ncbi:peptidase S8 S53 subtilisin kexin sedolisin [Fusarium pseudocircinatum]|uniref:Peptidase S8 S53 subtilisin kexin sedolisin n=1 Tax=Fusarium pseudocircinatum TaxID=56676 RepID=A0A8H5NWZ3_9HYPO|nr:peptidase S8 S53 subtilisin kexin sedolisin [Fusarium pseudocircinatum]
MGDVTPPRNAQVIEVNGITVDPRKHYAENAEHTNHIIVTLKDILTQQQQITLEDLGVNILEDLGNLNYLCHYDPPDLDPIRALTTFVRQVDVYRNIMKIPKNLRDVLDDVLKSQSEKEVIPCTLDVMIHNSEVDEDTVADSIAANADLNRAEFELGDGKIRLTATWQQLQTIVQDDNVRIIEEVIVPELHDSKAVEIVMGGGHSNEAAMTLSSYQGKGQTIAVNDTGFDLGSRSDCHPAFRGSIERLISVGRAKGPTDTSPAAGTVDDPQGHGTHVCGTIVARGIHTDHGLVTGVAPEAKLIMTSLLENTRNLKAMIDVKTLFEEPYQNHLAFIHSNSWGDPLGFYYAQRIYGDSAKAIDEFVCNNPQALIIFSAGNNNEQMLKKWPLGQTKPSIGSQAAAKNCLTVGASGTTRKLTPEEAATADSAETAQAELAVFNPDMVLSDSSRGPTAEKRTKPDVVAPGYNIFSAFSRHPDVNYSAPKAKSEEYANVLWKVRSGTSHATPLVAGCAAILREIYQEKNGGLPSSSPPAALLKAVIINGANRLPNVDKEAQGFGRVNLQNSASMLETRAVHHETVSSTTTLPSYPGGTLIGPPLKHLETFSFSLDPPSPDFVGNADRSTFELKVTMVYNDLPGAMMQNNLNLALIDHSADALHHGGVSEDDMSKQNNVEQVILCPVPRTPVTVRVVAQKMFKPAEGTQDFSLAWSVTRVYAGFKE